jgi:spermidine synthase
MELRRRGHEFLIRAGGRDLMSSEDDVSSLALAELGCAHLDPAQSGRVLVGGLGMGFTLRAALDSTGRNVVVECVEMTPAVVDWNRAELGGLAEHPLDDARVELEISDVRAVLRRATKRYDAILLDVDNGPDALAHQANDGLYSAGGIDRARAALRPGGTFCVWSFSDDPGFTRRLERAGFEVQVHRVAASRKGRGRHHVIWVATRR